MSGTWLSFGCWVPAVVAHSCPWSSSFLRVSWKISKGRTFGFSRNHFPGLVACDIWERVAWQAAGGGNLLTCPWDLTKQDLPSEKTIKISLKGQVWTHRELWVPLPEKKPPSTLLPCQGCECHQPLLCASLGYSSHLPEQMSYLRNVCNFNLHKLIFN